MIKAGAANAKTTARAEQKAVMEEALLNHEQVKSVQLRTIKQFKQKHAEMLAKTLAAGHVSTVVGDGVIAFPFTGVFTAALWITPLLATTSIFSP